MCVEKKTDKLILDTKVFNEFWQAETENVCRKDKKNIMMHILTKYLPLADWKNQ